MLISLIVIITLQCVCLAKQQILYLKYLQILPNILVQYKTAKKKKNHQSLHFQWFCLSRYEAFSDTPSTFFVLSVLKCICYCALTFYEWFADLFYSALKKSPSKYLCHSLSEKFVLWKTLNIIGEEKGDNGILPFLFMPLQNHFITSEVLASKSMICHVSSLFGVTLDHCKHTSYSQFLRPKITVCVGDNLKADLRSDLT